jgi:hypothetical protein
MNESLNFMIVLTKVTFVTASVVNLILDSTCFILRLPLSALILAHVLVKCHFKAFVALSRSSRIFYQNCVRMKTLMARVELGRTLSRRVNLDAFLFKAIKGS